MSICSLCKIKFEKKNKEYYCAPCNKEYFKQYRLNNKNKIKIDKQNYYLRNTEKVKNDVKKYALANPEKIKKQNSKYYNENKDRIKQQVKKYASENQEKIKEYRKQYYLKNSEKVKKRTKQWTIDNIERYKERCFIYRQTHKEEQKIALKTWIANNREKYNAKQRANYRNYIARKKGAEGKHSYDDILKLFEKQNKLCNICECDINEYYEVDHIYPITRGGSNWPDNLQLLCLLCNRSKNNKTMEEFYIYLEKCKDI